MRATSRVGGDQAVVVADRPAGGGKLGVDAVGGRFQGGERVMALPKIAST